MWRQFQMVFCVVLLGLASCVPATGMPEQVVSTPATSRPQRVVSTVDLLLPSPASQPTATPTVTALLVSPPTQPQGILGILRLQMIDANVGWAEGGISQDGLLNPNLETAGYYLLRTTDGGETWQDVTPPVGFRPALGYGAGVSLFAIDAQTAWATSAGRLFSVEPPYTLVWRTTDGGQSWRPSNPIYPNSVGTPAPIFSPWLQFVDEKHGWLTLHFQQRIQSIDMQYRSSDGGITWDAVEGCSTFDGASRACDVPLFTDSQTGWLRNTSTGEIDLATAWQVQKTRDGGRNWQNVDLPQIQEASGCYQTFARISTDLVGLRLDCGTLAGSAQSYYYLSADQGQTWRSLLLPGKPFSLVSPTSAFETSYIHISATGNAFFLDLTTGWRLSLADSYQLERTLDGGVTWHKLADNLTWNDGFQFTDAEHGWVVIGGSKTELHRTTDGGRNWIKLTPRLLPITQDSATAIFENSRISRLDVGFPVQLRTLQMIDSLYGWGVTLNGYIVHTHDGAQTWLDVTPRFGKIFNQRSFFAFDSQHAWTTVNVSEENYAQGMGVIWYTEDGGQTWQPTSVFPSVDRPGAAQEADIHFQTDSLGWVTWRSGQGYYRMKTDDNGQTWEADRLGDSLFLDERVGLSVQFDGNPTLKELKDGNATPLLIRTSDSGQTWEEFNLPPFTIETEKIFLSEYAYPGGLSELFNENLDCSELAFHIFSTATIGLQVTCLGPYRDIYGTYGYKFQLREYYLSTDAGQTWTNWMTSGYDYESGEEWYPPASEFFLNKQLGWRLEAGLHTSRNRILQTNDGGRTWNTIKTVSWREAQFYFIDALEGWAIARDGKIVALLHTQNGGRTWDEIKPVSAP